MDTDKSNSLQKNSLVLYKSNPARICTIGAKIEIELLDKKTVKVREKDITLIHKGPINNLSDINTEIAGDIEAACEMLYGETVSIDLFAELVYGAFTPASAWAVCRLLQDDLYITGSPDNIRVRTKEDYDCVIKNRLQKAVEKELWNAFINRIREGKTGKDDYELLLPLKNMALGKATSCKILKELKMQDTMQQAHKLLLQLGIWDYKVNPSISRLGFTETVEYPSLEPLIEENRLDLTHLNTYAIDDEGNQDPDDAISIDGDKLWIHIADVASIVQSESSVDIHARENATTLYLPEKTVTMLPPEAVSMLGLGLQEISPALSFGITLKESGEIDSVEICLSMVKVKRLTYTQAHDLLGTSPLKEMFSFAQKYRQYRKSQNAVFLSFPEVKIRVVDGIVTIIPLPAMNTKEMVTDCMLMAGDAAAQFAVRHDLPFPYTVQQSPETIETPEDYAAMFNYRKQLKPSSVKCTPDQHAGLGLKMYSRVTSPLRRYLDLVAHQQIRAFLTKKTLLIEQDILNRIGLSEARVGNAQKLERLSNLHWTLVYLLQNPKWQGKGIVVEKRDRYSTVLIPDIALETRLNSTLELTLNQEIELCVSSIDLADLSVHFSVV